MSVVTVSSRSSLCLVIGDPIEHSLSPSMHNAAYEKLSLPFVMAAARVKAADLPDAIGGVRALGIRGLAVTMPHKVAIIPLLDSLDNTARAIGAVNTVVSQDGALRGYNTDHIGITAPLLRRGPLHEKRVAILGAGGAAQAAAHGCSNHGASVLIFNRSLEKARPLADACGGEAYPLSDSGRIRSCDIIINTTSLGMGDTAGTSPIPPECLEQHHTVFETIYHPHSTQLVKDSEAKGATTIRGLEMFLEQGLAQFELHTGVKGPRDEMERILKLALNS